MAPGKPLECADSADPLWLACVL